MTIYIHFNIRTGKAAERLFNVSLVQDLGDGRIEVVNMFGGKVKTFSEVSHIAMQPDKEAV